MQSLAFYSILVLGVVVVFSLFEGHCKVNIIMKSGILQQVMLPIYKIEI